MFLEKFAIENFRLFKERVEFEFRPITILIGANNSGKSTLLKALNIFSYNAKDYRNKKNFPERLFLDFHDLGIHNADHFFSESDNDQKFKTEMHFLGAANKDYFLIYDILLTSKLCLSYKRIDNNSLYLTSLELYEKILGNKIISYETNVNFDTNSKSIKSKSLFVLHRELSRQLSFFLKHEEEPILDIYNKLQQFTNEQSGQLSATNHPDIISEMEPLGYDADSITYYTHLIDSLTFFKDKYYKEIESTFVTFLREFILELEEFSKNDTARQYYWRGFDFAFQRKAIKGISAILYDCLDIYFEDLEQSFASNYQTIDSSRNVPKRYYSINDGEIGKNLFNRRFKIYQANILIKNVLGIADEIKIEDIDGYLKKILIVKNNKAFNLFDMGYGMSQLLPLILDADFLDVESGYINHIWLISEPESNLHPALQSKLADLFAYLIINEGSNFLIETHSEYLIRKLQFLVRTRDNIKASDVVIYYLYNPDDIPLNEQQVKKIEIDEDGNLTSEFPPGFYDESSRIALELWNLNFSQKN